MEADTDRAARGREAEGDAMRFAIMGTGSVGGFFGGCLARGGADVTFIARGDNLRALREQGLHVHSAAMGDFHLPTVLATDDPGAVGPVDVVLMCSKGYDLETGARQMQPLVGRETVVIPVLNGVDIAERVGAVVGMEHLMGGLVRVSAKLERPGVVRHISWGVLLFGELEGGISPRGERILAALRAAETQAELLPDIRRELWSKFVQNATGAVCTVMRRSPYDVVRDPETRALAIACLRETEAVARALGVPLEADICETVMTRADAIPPEMKPSMLLDLERGRRLELENVTGVVVRLGQDLGVATPVNRFVYAALKLHANGTDTPAVSQAPSTDGGPGDGSG